MSKAKEKAQDLIAEDSELENVLERILEVEEEKGEVTWGDVKTEATSGQWGRLIEKGILEESEGDGFVLADKEGAEELLGIRESEDESDDEPMFEEDEDEPDTSWSLYDKLAGLVAVFFILFGYRAGTTQDVISGVIGGIVEPLMQIHGGPLPAYLVITILAMATGLYSSFLQKYLVDWQWINEKREKISEVQSDMKGAQLSGDDEKKEEMAEKRQEMASENMKVMKMQFRPTVWIMLITIPIFIWLIWKYRQGHVSTPPTIHMPFMGEDPIPLTQNVIPLLPFGQAWFAWYIICSFGMGQVIRKAVGYNVSS